MGSNENLGEHRQQCQRKEPSAGSCHLQAGAACSIPEEAARFSRLAPGDAANPLPSPASFVSLLRLHYWQSPTEKGSSFNQVPSVHVI